MTPCNSFGSLLAALENDRRHVYKVRYLKNKSSPYLFIASFNNDKWSLFPKTKMVNLLKGNGTSLPDYLFWILNHRFINETFNSSSTNATLLTNRELLQHAAGWYLNDWCEALKCKLIVSSLFESFDEISLAPYEGHPAIGYLCVVPPSCVPDTTIRFQRTPSISDSRSIRKLIEITSSDNMLFCDGDKIYGMGKPPLHQTSSTEPMIIHFNGPHKWSAIRCDSTNALITHFEVTNGIPSIYRPPLTRAEFNSKMKAVFPAITRNQSNILWRIMVNLLNAKHSALAIIDIHSPAESSRLRQQSIPITPDILSKKRIQQLCKIDGALLFDLDGKCHAFGAILDGHASATRGDPSRGSRYNSAIRYVQSRSGMAVALVMSEDGYVDFIV